MERSAIKSKVAGGKTTQKSTHYRMLFLVSWSRRDSNPRPNIVRCTLSTCLVSLCLSGERKVGNTPVPISVVAGSRRCLATSHRPDLWFDAPDAQQQISAKRDKGYARSNLGCQGVVVFANYCVESSD